MTKLYRQRLLQTRCHRGRFDYPNGFPQEYYNSTQVDKPDDYGCRTSEESGQCVAAVEFGKLVTLDCLGLDGYAFFRNITTLRQICADSIEPVCIDASNNGTNETYAMLYGHDYIEEIEANGYNYICCCSEDFCNTKELIDSFSYMSQGKTCHWNFGSQEKSTCELFGPHSLCYSAIRNGVQVQGCTDSDSVNDVVTIRKFKEKNGTFCMDPRNYPEDPEWALLHEPNYNYICWCDSELCNTKELLTGFNREGPMCFEGKVRSLQLENGSEHEYTLTKHCKGTKKGGKCYYTFTEMTNMHLAAWKNTERT